MKTILLLILLSLPVAAQTDTTSRFIPVESEQDTIFRVVFKDGGNMLFGNNMNMGISLIEFYEIGTGKTYILKKDSIEYIKTPGGYIIFERKIKSVKESSNNSVRALFFVTVNLGGKEKISSPAYNIERDVKILGSLSFETDFGLMEGNEFQKVIDLKLGLGGEYLLPHSVKDADGKFYFVSVFGTGKLCFLKDEPISPSLFIRGGVNYFSGDDAFKKEGDLSGGFYMSTGISITFWTKLELRGAYTVNNGEIGYTFRTEKDKFKYERLDLSLGYRIF